MSEEWVREFANTADRRFDDRDEDAQDRISSKPDETGADRWRTPMNHFEALEGRHTGKFRIGPFRPGCRGTRRKQVRYVLRITKRGGDADHGDD